MNNQIISIKVLGSGCSTCKKLFELTKQAVTELNLQTEVKYVSDLQEVMELGVMSVPALMINDEVVLAGQIPGIEKIKKLIAFDSGLVNKEPFGACSCGGRC